ncbi:hypothetical protein TURU_014746 [Turdus rufiventris]|nr:hypothetical protein TURU_014746 [Turdus rufiventris]
MDIDVMDLSVEKASRCHCKDTFGNLSMITSIESEIWAREESKGHFCFQKLQEDPINWSGSTQFPVNMIEQLNLETISRVKSVRVIRSSQHGLMKRNLYFTNLVTFCNDWLGERRAAGIAQCDFTKAFGTVSE